MFKLKKYSVTPSVQVSAEALQDQIEDLQYRELTDSLEADVTQLANVQDFIQLSNNITNYGMESVALMQLAAKTLGVSDVGIASMESLVVEPTVSNEAFVDKAKELGKKIIEKLKKLWAWMTSGKEKIKKDQVDIKKKVDDMSTVIDEEEISTLKIVGVSQEELTELSSGKFSGSPKNTAIDVETGTLYLHNPAAAYFFKDNLKPINDYLEAIIKLDEKKLDPVTNGEATVTECIKVLSILSTKKPTEDGHLTLDLLPLPQYLNVELPTVDDKGVKSSMRVKNNSGDLRDITTTTPRSYQGTVNVEEVIDNISKLSDTIVKLSERVGSSSSTWAHNVPDFSVPGAGSILAHSFTGNFMLVDLPAMIIRYIKRNMGTLVSVLTTYGSKSAS